MIEDACDYGIQCSFQLDSVINIKSLRVHQHKQIEQPQHNKFDNEVSEFVLGPKAKVFARLPSPIIHSRNFLSRKNPQRQSEWV